MGFTGRQKAAILLTSLDAITATELLKGIKPEVVQELAVEMAYLDAMGMRGAQQSMEVASQFCNSLRPSNKGFRLKDFLDNMLKSTVGAEKAKQIQVQIDDLLRKRDPFMNIRGASSQTLASVLGNEHPQAVAVVLSELPAKRGSEVLALLGDNIRLGAISGMATISSVTAEARKRVAEMIAKKLEILAAQQQQQGGGEVQAAGAGDPALRKVAIVLRNLGKEIRDGMIAALQEKDAQVAEKVCELMVQWEDILQVADRSMQEALRGMDSQKLAMALYKADESIIKKIKSNISERAAAAIDEEASLMSTPKKEDIAKVKDEMLSILREMNKKEELNFIEE